MGDSIGDLGLAHFGWSSILLPSRLLHSPVLVYYQIRETKRVVEVLHLRHGSWKPERW